MSAPGVHSKMEALAWLEAWVVERPLVSTAAVGAVYVCALAACLCWKAKRNLEREKDPEDVISEFLEGVRGEARKRGGAGGDRAARRDGFTRGGQGEGAKVHTRKHR